MGILAWIVLGLIAGAIAKVILPGNQGGGFISTMLLGIIGAFVGGSLHTFFTTGALQLASVTFTVGGIVVAVLGAIVTVFVWSLITRAT